MDEVKVPKVPNVAVLGCSKSSCEVRLGDSFTFDKYAVQCSKCSVWRDVEKVDYEVIREKMGTKGKEMGTEEFEFECESVSDYGCEDTSDTITQDGSHVWVYENAGVPKPPEGYTRRLSIRSDLSRVDVSYQDAKGKVFTGRIQFQNFLINEEKQKLNITELSQEQRKEILKFEADNFSWVLPKIDLALLWKSLGGDAVKIVQKEDKKRKGLKRKAELGVGDDKKSKKSKTELGVGAELGGKKEAEKKKAEAEAEFGDAVKNKKKHKKKAKKEAEAEAEFGDAVKKKHKKKAKK